MIFFENFESDTAESILYRYPDCIRNTKGEDNQTAFPLFGGNKFGTFTKNLPERMEIFLRFTDNDYVGANDSEIILFDIVKLKSINQEVNIIHDNAVIRVPRPAKVIDALYIDLNIQNSIINVLINGVEVALLEDFPITDYFGLSDSAINVTEGDDTGFKNFVSEIILIEDTPQDQMIDLTSLRIVEDIPTIELLPDEEAFTQTISPIDEILRKNDPLDTTELLYSSLRDSILVDAGIDITYANQDNKLQSKIYAATFNTNKHINVSIDDKEIRHNDEHVVVSEVYIDESNNTHQIRFVGVDHGPGSVVEFKSFEGTEYGFILGAHGPITVEWGIEHGEKVYVEYPESLVTKEYISPLSIEGDEEVSVTIYGDYDTLITSHVNTNRVIEWRTDLEIVSCSPSTINFSASSNFEGAANIKSVPVTLPPNVTSLDYFFENASSFNSPLPWDTSMISSMVGTFKNASSFDQPLSWNTASVEFMEEMFNGALSFNQDLSGWNVELIPEEPANFATNTPSWVKENRMPKWANDEQALFPHMICNNDNVCYVDWASIGKQLNAGSFISYSDFLTEVGLEGIGQLNPSDDGLDEWIYMVIDGQEVVFPKIPILTNISFIQLYEKGLVYGVDGNGPFVPSTPTNQNVVVTIQGTRYQVRLFSGIDNPGTVWTGVSTGLDLEGTKRSEWSRLIYPLISDLEEGVYSGSPLHSITQVEFDGNTGYSFTQDFNSDDNILLRGPNSVAGISESTTNEQTSMVGYRPILIKLDKAVAPEDLFYTTEFVKSPIIIDNYYKD